MEIKNYTIKTDEDVFAFLLHLMKDLDLNFHPDTDFNLYVNKEGHPVFSPQQAEQLSVMLYACEQRLGDNIYFYTNLANHFLMLYNYGKSRTPDPNSIQPVLEQIDNYFENILVAKPYLTNWSIARDAATLKRIAYFYTVAPENDEFILTFYTEMGNALDGVYVYPNGVRLKNDLDELIKFGLKAKLKD